MCSRPEYPIRVGCCLRLSPSLYADGIPTSSNPGTPGFVTEPSEASAGTPQSLCSTAPSPAAAAAVSLTPAAPAKQQLRLLHQKAGETAAFSSNNSSCSTYVGGTDGAANSQGPPAGPPAVAAGAARSPLLSSALCDEQQLVPCCTLESLPAGLLLQHLPHSETGPRTRRDSTCSSSCVSSTQSIRKGLVGLSGRRSIGGRRRGADGTLPKAAPSGSRLSACSVTGEEAPAASPAATSGAPLSRRASDVIGVGVMSAKASTVYGHDQQQVVSRIQGLPLMQRVYLLAACRSAQKKLLDRAAAAATAMASGGGGALERRRSAAAMSSQESRSSQNENIAPTNKPSEAGGVYISLEEVEVSKCRATPRKPSTVSASSIWLL